MLCKLLTATGHAGLPDSHFHNPSVAAWLDTYNIVPREGSSEVAVLQDIFEAARIRGAGDTGMFGLRMQAQSFEFFLQKLQVLHTDSANDLDRIEKTFGQTLFVHLTREDKLSQAISYVKAEQTGLWHKAADGTELERRSSDQKPFYDSAAIASTLSKFTAMDESWSRWFAKECINPFQIQYENLSNNPVKTLRELLEQLGLNGDLVHGLEVPVAKLSDSVNRSWAKQFLDDNPSYKNARN